MGGTEATLSGLRPARCVGSCTPGRTRSGAEHLRVKAGSERGLWRRTPVRCTCSVFPDYEEAEGGGGVLLFCLGWRDGVYTAAVDLAKAAGAKSESDNRDDVPLLPSLMVI